MAKKRYFVDDVQGLWCCLISAIFAHTPNYTFILLTRNMRDDFYTIFWIWCCLLLLLLLFWLLLLSYTSLFFSVILLSLLLLILRAHFISFTLHVTMRHVNTLHIGIKLFAMSTGAFTCHLLLCMLLMCCVVNVSVCILYLLLLLFFCSIWFICARIDDGLSSRVESKKRKHQHKPIAAH